MYLELCRTIEYRYVYNYVCSCHWSIGAISFYHITLALQVLGLDQEFLNFRLLLNYKNAAAMMAHADMMGWRTLP